MFRSYSYQELSIKVIISGFRRSTALGLVSFTDMKVGLQDSELTEVAGGIPGLPAWPSSLGDFRRRTSGMRTSGSGVWGALWRWVSHLAAFIRPHMPLASSRFLDCFGGTRGELCLDGLALGGPVWKVTRLQWGFFPTYCSRPHSLDLQCPLLSLSLSLPKLK